MAEFLCERLKMIRKRNGWTQQDVASRVSLSRSAYCNIETGRFSPSGDVVQKLADVFAVPVSEFFAQDGRIARIRLRGACDVTERQKLISTLSSWVEAFEKLEVDEDGSAKSFVQEFSGKSDDPVALAKGVREKLGLDEPSRSLCEALEDEGFAIITCESDLSKFFGCSASTNGTRIIMVNTAARIPVERWIFTLAHELGHLLMHQESFQADDDVEDLLEEKDADVFASHLLVPVDRLEAELKRTVGLPFDLQVLAIKRLFNVSYKTILYRLQDFDGYDKRVWPVFYSAYKRRRNKSLSRTTEPDPLRPEAFFSCVPPDNRDSEPEPLFETAFLRTKLSQLVKKAYLEGKIRLDEAARLFGVETETMNDIATSWFN